MLLFPVGFIAPSAPLGTSSKLGLGPTTERLVAAVEAAFAAWSVSKLTLGTAVKRLVAVTRRAAIGIEFASGSTGKRLVAIARRAVVKAALAAWLISKLTLGSTAKRLVAFTRRAAVKAALAAGGTIGFFKTGRGGVAVRAISAWAREGKLSAAVGSAFL